MIPNLDHTTSYAFDSRFLVWLALNQNAHVVSIPRSPCSCTRSPAFAPTTLFLTLLASPTRPHLIPYIHLSLRYLSLSSFTSGRLGNVPASVPLVQPSLDTLLSFAPNFCYDESFIYVGIRVPCVYTKSTARF